MTKDCDERYNFTDEHRTIRHRAQKIRRETFRFNVKFRLFCHILIWVDSDWNLSLKKADSGLTYNSYWLSNSLYPLFWVSCQVSFRSRKRVQKQDRNGQISSGFVALRSPIFPARQENHLPLNG